MIKCSVGVCVFNEEKNIAGLLRSLSTQKLKNISIDEILVISSGSYDNTSEIVRRYSRLDKRIKLIEQKKREGKASAVNLFIHKAKNEVLVLLGGDLLLREDTLQKLIVNFSDPEIGMTGAHPTPVNNIKDGLSNFSTHLLWELHHRISLRNPKMGETVAFRKIFKRIPISSSVDEANIEPLIRGQGYKIKYVPQATVYNKGPTNLGDFIRQRRRIYCGHLALKQEQNYEVSTLNVFRIFRAFLFLLRENPHSKFFLFSFFTLVLEGYSRFLGWWDYFVVRRRHTVWEIAESTKKL